MRPSGTPDGSRVVYQSTSNRGYDLFWTRADGGGSAEQLTRRAGLAVPGSWTPDGRWLVFSDFDARTGWDMWTLTVDADRTPQPLLQTSANELMPALSPDGRWLAYVSDESGRPEVFVRAFPGSAGPWQISLDGGNEPVWARSGKELFYRQRDTIMAVDIATAPAFAPSKPSRLFQIPDEPFDHYWLPNYDVAPDGQQFLTVKSRDAATDATRIHVVLDWF